MERIRGLNLPELRGPAAAPERQGPAGAAGGASFAEALGQALSSTEALQQGADAEVSKLAQGAGNLHETALALEKADVAMRVLTKVRNKVVDAYQEIMRMSV
jgi:flagellar hook-basal body complex protein FliE